MPSEPEQTFEARYGDGRTAASLSAQVRIRAGGLEIKLRGGRRLEWPLSELETLTALDKKASDIVIRRVQAKAAAGAVAAATGDPDPKTDYGATLFVKGADFPMALAAAAPHLTVRHERWRYTKPGLAVAAVAVLLLGTLWAVGINSPRRVAGLFPDSWWAAIGEQVISSLTSGKPVCTGADGKAALDRLMLKLSSATVPATVGPATVGPATVGPTTVGPTGPGQPAPRRPGHFEARVIDWGLVNAFAVPGGQIVVTRGLINAAGSADELAGVIAHEIGHGLERHPEASVIRGLGLATLTKILFAGGPETIAGLGTNLLQLQYTRDAEREADARAVDTLRTARIPAKGLADFFDRLRKREGGGSNVPQILSTHPSLDERLATISKLPIYAAEPAATAADFAALKRMCAK